MTIKGDERCHALYLLAGPSMRLYIEAVRVSFVARYGHTLYSKKSRSGVDTAGGIRAATVRLTEVCRYGLVPMTSVDNFHQK